MSFLVPPMSQPSTIMSRFSHRLTVALLLFVGLPAFMGPR